MADLLPTIFSIAVETLHRLTGREAVRVFRGLLWAEARRCGIPPSQVTINETIEIADGGIDAHVEAAEVLPTRGALIAGTTWFQIKAGDSFKPWQQSMVRKELIGKNAPSRDALGSEVRRCLESGGRYVLVSFGHDLTPQQKSNAESEDKEKEEGGEPEDHFRSVFDECGFPNATVEVWGSGHLVGFLQSHPSLCLQLNGRTGFSFQTIESWATNVDMTHGYVQGPQHAELIERVQEELRSGDAHVRLIGEPGLGKTRLALEALRAEDLAPLVLYCEHAKRFRNGPLLIELLRSDNPFHAILVLDDCDYSELTGIWNLIQPHAKRIRLVSIAHDPDPSSADSKTLRLPLPALLDEQAKEILNSYDVRSLDASHWVRFCEGSPRVAHVIGRNLQRNPNDLLVPPDYSNIWERFVVGGDDSDSPNVVQRWTVLRFLALFQRFGFDEPVEYEGEAIAALVQEADLAITYARFCSIIETLRHRRIVQGVVTLRIVPKALHIWLWLEWWRHYGRAFRLDRFADLPGDLPSWFCRMFSYGAASPAAQRQARRLLRDESVTNGVGLRTSAGADLFEALAQADPGAALEFLERTLGTWSTEELLRFDTGRRQVIRALQCIIVWRQHFGRGALLLLRLAEFENERWSNNATGLFSELFTPGPGSVAPTEAPPKERFPVLEEALTSDSSRVQEAFLSACKVALRRLGSFMRMSGPEYQGLRTAKLWWPKTYGEIYEAYREAWRLLRNAYRTWIGKSKDAAAALLLKAGPPFIEADGFLRTTVLDTFDELAEPPTYRRELIATLLRLLNQSRREMEAETRERVQGLYDRLVDSSLVDQIRRHVGMNLHADRPFDVDWKEAEARIKSTLRDLAAKLLADQELFDNLLPWLLSKDSERALQFALEMAQLEGGSNVLQKIIEAQTNLQNEDSSLDFLAGFIHCLSWHDESAWEKQLDEFAVHPKQRSWVGRLTACSKALTERAAERLIHLVEEAAMPAMELARWRWAKSFTKVSEDVVRRWIELLIESDDGQASVAALEITRNYYCDNNYDRTLPLALTKRVLHKAMPIGRSRESGQDYAWSELAQAFFEGFLGEGPKLLELALRAHAEEDFASPPQNRTGAVLRVFFYQHTAKCWGKIVQLLEIPRVRYMVLRWLQGDRMPFGPAAPVAHPLIPDELLWPWIDQDPIDRACFIAGYLPKTFEGKGGIQVREMIVRYGHLEEVLRALHANFGSIGWRGSEAETCQQLRQQILGWLPSEEHPVVRRWLQEQARHYAVHAERASVREEREW